MIKGKKVLLRPVEERDLELLTRWRNDPEIRRYFFSPFLVNPGAQKKWYQQLLADTSRSVGMIETLEGKTVGVFGLDHIDWRNQSAEGGQVIIDPEERGKGYIEEANILGTNYAFNELNLHRITCYLYAFSPVIEMLKWLGFKQEGVLRKAVFTQGEFQDVVVMGLLREEWDEDGWEETDDG